jgi:hypothetical protein
MAQALKLSAFQDKVSAMLRDLPDAMLKINQELAVNARTKLLDRLTERGQTAEGKSLGKYSNNPMSPLFFLGKGIKSADAKLKAKVKAQQKAGQKPGVSYEEWRIMNGLPVDHVTLSFNNETLPDVGVLNTVTDKNSVITIVGSRDSKSKDIINSRGKKTGEKSTGQVLDDLDSKYGRALDTELLSLSKQEEEDLADLLDKKLQSFLDQNFA